MVCLDGGRGAYSAIKRTWPSTQIQRCLVHAQRVVRRYVTSRPRTDAGQDIYRLARNLTRITDLDQAAKWSAQLHNFHLTYKDYLNEKTLSIITGKDYSPTFECVKPITASKISTVNNGYLPTSIRPITPRIQISNGHRLPTAWKADLTPHSNNTPDSTEEEAVNDNAKPSTGGYTCEYISRKPHKK